MTAHIFGYCGGNALEGKNLEVGAVVRLKKKHPCGSSEWKVLRVGADIRLECVGCGHMIMAPRKKVEKNMLAIS